jgi:hypothetical protein
LLRFVARSPISRVTSAELSVKGKAQRGYELLDDDEGPPAKTDAVTLSPETATRDAFAVIAASCVKQVMVQPSSPGAPPRLSANDLKFSYESGTVQTAAPALIYRSIRSGGDAFFEFRAADVSRLQTQNGPRPHFAGRARF